MIAAIYAPAGETTALSRLKHGFEARRGHQTDSGSLSLDVVRDDPMPRRGCSTQDPRAYSLRSRKVEAIEVHHLGPGRDEVLDELRLRIRASVDLRQGAELGVRTEDEIDARAGPLELRPSCDRALRTRPWRPTLPSTPCPCRAGSRRSRWSALPAAW